MPQVRVDAAKCPKFLIGGKLFLGVMPVTKFSTVVTDPTDPNHVAYLFVHFGAVEGVPVGTRALGSMPCQELCGHRLKRWHASCFTCIYRKVWTGKIPSLIPLKMLYTVFISRWQSGWKAAVHKRLSTLLEMTAF
jgi:hypothetical protein